MRIYLPVLQQEVLQSRKRPSARPVLSGMLRLHLSRCAANLRHARPRLFSAKSGDVALLEGRPFKEIRIGVPREVADGEKRVASTPESVALLVKKGFKVSVQSGAGLPVSANICTVEVHRSGMARCRDWTHCK